MSDRARHRCETGRWWALCVVVALAVRGVDAAPDVAVNEAAEARKLQGEFQKAKSFAARQAAAEAMLVLHADGGRRLHAIARAELLRRTPRYSAACQRVAAELLRERGDGNAASAEIASLRKTILDVAATGNLTKDLIVQKSDPALARLTAILLVSPADVLAADASLRSEREELLQLADWAERAAAVVPEKDRAKLPPLPGRNAVAAQLDAADEMAAMLAGGISPADRQVLAGNAAAAGRIDPEEARGIQRLNQIRILVGLPAQAIDVSLCEACRGHSRDMCEKGFFAHESPVAGREDPWKRAAAAGTSASAENIAAGADAGPAAIQMWWHSPGHHKNMLGNQKRTGLGRYQRHWTQLFG